MKSYVIDAITVFSALISGKEAYQKALIEHHFYMPDFGLLEIQKYQNLILKKTKIPLPSLREFTIRLFSSLIIVPNLLISTQSYFQAFQLCKDIDEKDTAYVALSIEFDIVLITKDIELVNGLRAKGFSNPSSVCSPQLYSFKVEL